MYDEKDFADESLTICRSVIEELRDMNKKTLEFNEETKKLTQRTNDIQMQILEPKTKKKRSISFATVPIYLLNWCTKPGLAVSKAKNRVCCFHPFNKGKCKF